VTSPVFERVGEELEKLTAMSLLEARGTLRLALKEAGLDPKHVNSFQMTVVVVKALEQELQARGVEDARAVCERLAQLLKDDDESSTPDAPDRIDGLFRRTL
jgi:hypothetical protein